MTIGAFAVVAVVAAPGRRRARARRLPRPRAPSAPARRACSRCSCSRRRACRSPGGFVAKLSVFSAAVDQRQYVLALDRHARRRDRRLRLPAHRAHDVLTRRRRGAARADRPRRRRLRHPHRARRSRRPRCCSSAIMPGGMLDFAKHATQLLSRYRLDATGVTSGREPASGPVRRTSRALAAAEAAALLRGGGRDRGAVERVVGELVRGVDQLARAREVEQVARVGRAGERRSPRSRAARTGARARSAGCARA